MDIESGDSIGRRKLGLPERGAQREKTPPISRTALGIFDRASIDIVLIGETSASLSYEVYIRPTEIEIDDQLKGKRVITKTTYHFEEREVSELKERLMASRGLSYNYIKEVEDSIFCLGYNFKDKPALDTIILSLPLQ